MDGHPRWLITTGAIVALAVIASAPVGAGRREKPPPCPPGRYVLPEPLLDVGSPVGAVVSASDAAVAIEGICDPIPPRKYKGARRGTKVKAKWSACAGLDGKVRLGGKIVEDCGTLNAKVKARRFRRRFEAPRSVCGDGVVDPGAGEECDPPAAGACDGSCRETVTALVGPGGGQVSSLDGGLRLDIPAGTLVTDTPITIRRLGPDDFPPIVSEIGALVAYDLGPDGLAFPVPITATFLLGPADRAEDGSIGGPLAFVLSLASGADDTEIPEGQTTMIDGGADMVGVSAQLDHFSTAFVPLRVQNRMFGEVQVTLPSDADVGQAFAVRLGVRINFDPLGPVTVSHADEPDRRFNLAYAGPAAVPITELATNVTRVVDLTSYSCISLGTLTYAGRLEGRAFFAGLRRGFDRSSEARFTLALTHDTGCGGIATTTSTIVGTSTTGTTSTTTTSTTSSTSTSSSSTTSTSSSTTTSTSTSTMPCSLIQSEPDPVTNPFPDPVCNGPCPPEAVCVFSAADGDCACRPVGDLCRDTDPDPQNAVCGGLCQNPDASCILQQDTGGGTSGCICADPCLAVRQPPDVGPFVCVEVGQCPPGKACDLDTCRCTPVPTTTVTSTSSTSSSSVSSTSTSSSSSSTSSSTPTSTTTTTSLPTTTTSIPAGPCASLDGTACGGACPGDQVCRALESRTGGGCLCVPPSSACPEGQPPDPQLGFCGGLCPGEDQLCADDGGTCVCSTCQLFDVDGTPTCFGGCADQFETCAAIGGDCACVPNGEFCQPQGGGTCAGRCPSPTQSCVPSGPGCACETQP